MFFVVLSHLRSNSPIICASHAAARNAKAPFLESSVVNWRSGCETKQKRISLGKLL